MMQIEYGTFIVYLFLYTTYPCILDSSVTTVHWDPLAPAIHKDNRIYPPLKRALLTTTAPPTKRTSPKVPPKNPLGPPGNPPDCAELSLRWICLI